MLQCFLQSLSPYASHPFFDSTDREKLPCRFLFTKLFDEPEVLQRRNHCDVTHPDQIYNTEEVVQNLRREAFQKFPNFLNEKIISFSLPHFGYSFLGLLSAISHRISSKGNPQNMIPHFSLDIPFAACVYFAFTQNQIGKLSELCGEIRNTPYLSAAISVEASQVRCMRETAYNIIIK